MEFKKIFSTPILESQVSTSLADKVEEIILPKLKNLEFTGQNFTDFFNSPLVEYSEISDLIETIYSEACIFWEKIGFKKSKNINYWIQDYKVSNYHEEHNHGIVNLSGTYWIRANEDAGNFVLKNPNPFISVSHNIIDNPTKYNNDYYEIIPEKGKFILFPSFLFHSVKPGGPNCIRTSFAFNFK